MSCETGIVACVPGNSVLHEPCISTWHTNKYFLLTSLPRLCLLGSLGLKFFEFVANDNCQSANVCCGARWACSATK